MQQRTQMFTDIQSLVASLLKAEGKLEKQKNESKSYAGKLKSIIDDQEHCMQLMQDKMERLNQKQAKVEKQEQKHKKENSCDRKFFE